MLNICRFMSKETVLYNDTYQISYFYYHDVNKASFQFRHLDSDAVVPIRHQYADANTPRDAFKIASAFLRGWTKQHLKDGWTGIVDLPAPNKSPRARFTSRPY